MARKPIVKVILSKEQRQILQNLVMRLGTSESELMRTAFMDYAKSLNLLNEYVHRLA